MITKITDGEHVNSLPDDAACSGEQDTLDLDADPDVELDAELALDAEDFFLDSEDMMEVDEDMWLEAEFPPATQMVPSATLSMETSSHPATLPQQAATLSTSSALPDNNAEPGSTPGSLQGPEWNLADLDSCPSAFQVSLDALDVSELSQSIINGGSDPAKSGSGFNGANVCSMTSQRIAISLLACTATSMSKNHSRNMTTQHDKQVSLVTLEAGAGNRVIDEMNLPSHVEGKPREQKIRHWASHGAMRRYITVTYPKGLAVNVIRLMQWAAHTRNLGRVKEVLEQYPVIMEDMVFTGTSPTVVEISDAGAGKYAWTFVVPEALVTSMQAAIETYFEKKVAGRKQMNEEPEEVDLVDSESEGEHSAVVKLRTNLVFFSSRCVLAMRSFYDVKKLANAWTRDMAWLGQNWFDIHTGPVEFLAMETRTAKLNALDRNFRYDNMATEIMAKYELASLASKYSLRTKNAFIHFREVVGSVARTEWLTGAAVNYGMAAICDGRNDCLMISTHDLDGHFPKDRSHKLVVVPANSYGMHWAVLMITIHNDSVGVHLYDLLGSSTHHKQLTRVWEANILPFLRKWDTHRRTNAEEEHEFPAHIPKHTISRPKQPDGGSCGIMVLAMVHTYARVATRGFELDTVTADYIKVLRLRLLWLVMCGSLIHATDQGDDESARTTDRELANVVKPSTAVKRQ